MTARGFKKVFGDVGTALLLDLGAGYKRWIHFVKIHLGVHFIRLLQKKKIKTYIIPLVMFSWCPWAFGGDKYCLQKERMPLSPHLEWLYHITWIASKTLVFRNIINESSDRGTVGFARLSGALPKVSTLTMMLVYWFERIFYHVRYPSVPILLIYQK